MTDGQLYTWDELQENEFLESTVKRGENEEKVCFYTFTQIKKKLMFSVNLEL